ncbi:glycosyltransferase family 39 protein [Tsukamurella soli]|uniref:glycosyltransferase family 39 protein n=1 Tax=Tsukamurella soli TaxID=644556 RepID=UPI00360B3D4F
MIRRLAPPTLFGLLGLLVSVWHANRPSFWFDELATVSAIDRSPGELWRMLGDIDVVHGLYYYAAALWAGTFGLGELSLRVFSSIGVGVAVALMYVLARRLGGPGFAVVAAVIAILLPRVTWAGVEARSYAWVIAATTGMLIAGHVAAQRPSRRRWLLYGLTVTLAVGLFLYTALAAAAALVPLAWGAERGMRWCAARPALIATVVPLAVLSPVIGLAATEKGQVDWLEWPGWMLPQNILVDQWFDHSWAFAAAAWALVAVAGLLLWRGGGGGGRRCCTGRCRWRGCRCFSWWGCRRSRRCMWGATSCARCRGWCWLSRSASGWWPMVPRACGCRAGWALRCSWWFSRCAPCPATCGSGRRCRSPGAATSAMPRGISATMPDPATACCSRCSPVGPPRRCGSRTRGCRGTS